MPSSRGPGAWPIGFRRDHSSRPRGWGVWWGAGRDGGEELTGWAGHVGQFGDILAGRGPAGRRLDFLAQELHREVTTLGNKSQSAPIARLVIDMKTEAERIREQVQNVE